MLTLVRPPRGGNGGSPPSRRKGLHAPSLSLTPDEARHLRASIRNIARTKYGTLRRLAGALEVPAALLGSWRGYRSPALAVAIWRLTGTPLEELLRGTLAALPGGAP